MRTTMAMRRDEDSVDDNDDGTGCNDPGTSRPARMSPNLLPPPQSPTDVNAVVVRERRPADCNQGMAVPHPPAQGLKAANADAAAAGTGGSVEGGGSTARRPPPQEVNLKVPRLDPEEEVFAKGIGDNPRKDGPGLLSFGRYLDQRHRGRACNKLMADWAMVLML